MSKQAEKLMRLIDREVKPKEEKPEKGFLTAVQWSKELGVSERTMFKHLRELVKKGGVEMKIFKTAHIDGHIHPTNYYRIKKKPRKLK